MINETFNEWDPLQEVIVGSVIGAQHMAFEPALGAYFELDPLCRTFPGSVWPEEEVVEAEKQLDALAALLSARGITVRRPKAFPDKLGYSTPDFSASYGNSYACPRDVLLVIGELVIEAPMAQRGRFFEYRGYRDIMLDHFNSGGRWLAAPKPLLDNRSFRSDYTTQFEPFDPIHHSVLTTRDPCFDAACFARCGRDIFWQPDMVSNDAGAEWLRRAIGPEYRVHRVEFEDRYPQHIDTTLVPLRPKLAMINPERPPRGGTLRVFERSCWSLVTPPPSVRAGLPAPARDVSNWIAINVLVLDPETVLVEASEDPLAEFLEKLSFHVIRTRFDKVYKFGGGFHCCTVDLRRDGRLQSYFDE
jgi:glycine amidinotransferase